MNSPSRVLSGLACVCCMALFAGGARAQTNPLKIFQNYFVTGDYTVAGWVKGASDGFFATGTISLPDCTQAQALNQLCPQTSPIPVGADIVAAYLYWETVESNQVGAQKGQQGFFNGSPITGTALPFTLNAPTTWSGGGCAGSSNGSKTINSYRADVRPYLPIDN